MPKSSLSRGVHWGNLGHLQPYRVVVWIRLARVNYGAWTLSFFEGRHQNPQVKPGELWRANSLQVALGAWKICHYSTQPNFTLATHLLKLIQVSWNLFVQLHRTYSSAFHGSVTDENMERMIEQMAKVSAVCSRQEVKGISEHGVGIKSAERFSSKVWDVAHLLSWLHVSPLYHPCVLFFFLTERIFNFFHPGPLEFLPDIASQLATFLTCLSVHTKQDIKLAYGWFLGVLIWQVL